MDSPKVNSGRLSLWLQAIMIFLLALAPRLIGLGQVLTTDEPKWIERSREFLLGLLRSDLPCRPFMLYDWVRPAQGLECTMRTGHPGATTMWAGSAGLWLYHHAVLGSQLAEAVLGTPVNPPARDLLPWVQLPSALITSLCLAGAFLALNTALSSKQGSGRWTAFIAAALMALSPFEIALSRLLGHDGLLTCFMLLSALCGFNYWIRERSKGWLILSGIFAGLGLMTKSPALFLLPYTGLLALWRLLRHYRRTEKRAGLVISLLGEGLLWLALLAVTSFVVYPAFWVIPAESWRAIFGMGFRYAEEGHLTKVFFMGESSVDPGPLFYPLTWLMRVSPFTLMGVVLAAGFVLARVFGGLRRRQNDPAAPENDDRSLWEVMAASLAYALFFTIAMTLAAKKGDRYLLPAYPFTDIIAAGGWFLAGRWLHRIISARRMTAQNAGYVVAGLAVLLLAGNGVLAFGHAPYYFTYYNPLLGGAPAAEELIPMGWGEGLDQAAGYLNAKKDASSLRVITYLSETFSPYFSGQTINFPGSVDENLLCGDYVVTYVGQEQRQQSPKPQRFLKQNFTIEKVIALQKIPYAWIYRDVRADVCVQGEGLENRLKFLGWKYAPSSGSREAPSWRPGEKLGLALFSQYLDQPAVGDFVVRLSDKDGQVWAETRLTGRTASGAPAEWQKGQLVTTKGEIAIPAETPAGEYNLSIGVFAGANDEEPVFFDVEDQPHTIIIR
jgi:hypothetical protein